MARPSWRVIRAWRITEVEGGLQVFFDPSIETVELRDLTDSELAARVDRSVSVSALPVAAGADFKQHSLFDEGDPPCG